MRKKTLCPILLALLLGTPLLGAAQENTVLAFSIKQCIEYATNNSNKVKNAILDEQTATAKAREVTALGLPQVNASLDVKNFIEVPTQVVPADAFPSPAGAPKPAPGTYLPVQFGIKYNTNAGFDASQIIFDGTYFTGLKASKTYQELARKNTERTKIETAVAVSKAYYSVLVNKERLDLVNTNVERLKKLQDDTKAMYDNGVVEKLDYDRITLSYNNILVEKQKVEQYVALSYYLLKFQMSMDIKTPIELTDKLSDLTTTTINGAFAEKIDYTKRIEYNLALTQEKWATIDLRKNQMSRVPSLIAYGTFMESNFTDKFSGIYDPNYSVVLSTHRWFPAAFIGAKLSVPIIGGYQRGFRIQQAKLALEKAGNDRKTTEQAIDLEYRSAVISYVNDIAALDEQKKNLELANEVTKTTKIKYDQGVGSNLEVITAEASLKEAQTNYYNALYEALVAKVDLDRAMGVIKY